MFRVSGQGLEKCLAFGPRRQGAVGGRTSTPAEDWFLMSCTRFLSFFACSNPPTASDPLGALGSNSPNKAQRHTLL